MPTTSDLTGVRDEPATLPTETMPPLSQPELRDISSPAASNLVGNIVVEFRVASAA